MSISPGLRNVLNILAELAQNDIDRDVFESSIVSRSGLPEFEVQNYLNELKSRGLAKEVGPRPGGADFKLWRITQEGIEALKDQALR
jgi:hypothetical protein